MNRSDAAQQARRNLGMMLRGIRLAADLTAVALAERCGWHHSKISRIEHGKQKPSTTDVRRWCTNASATAQIATVLAALQHAESLYIEWRVKAKGGLAEIQFSELPLYRQTRHFRMYEPFIVPGLLQVPEYAQAIFRGTPRGVRASEREIREAVDGRLARQAAVRRSRARLTVVIEEFLLRIKIGSPETMRKQLVHFRSLIDSPRLTLGVIPIDSVWRDAALPLEGFWIFDSNLVQVETLHASVEITVAAEIPLFEEKFAALTSIARVGDDAMRLIDRAIKAL